MWTDKIPEEDGYYWVCKKNFKPTVASLTTIEGEQTWMVIDMTPMFTSEQLINEGFSVFGPKLNPPPKRTI